MSVEDVRRALVEKPELMDELPPPYQTLARSLLWKGKRTTGKNGGESPCSTHI